MKYKNLSWIILFGGSGRSKVITNLYNSGINISKIIVPKKQSEKLKDDIIKLEGLNIPLLAADKKNLKDILQFDTESPLLSIGFPLIISEEIFSKHPIAINVHPTLLPQYRGATSGAHILINNEKISGSTVHVLTPEVDKGPIICQSKIEINPFDTLRSMQRKVYKTEPKLVLDAIRFLDNGNTPKQQDESKASHYKKIRTPEDSMIDPSKPLKNLINEIRATDFEEFPPFFYYHGEKLYLKIWRKHKSNENRDEL